MDNNTRSQQLTAAMQEANEHYRTAQQTLGTWLEQVRDCGEALCRAKKLFGPQRGIRRTWRVYVRGNFDGKSLETAQDYMTVYREWDNPILQNARRAGVEITSIRRFMGLLRYDPPAPDTASAGTAEAGADDETGPGPSVDRHDESQAEEQRLKAIRERFVARAEKFIASRKREEVLLYDNSTVRLSRNVFDVTHLTIKGCERK
jgi:hypothetical protein